MNIETLKFIVINENNTAAGGGLRKKSVVFNLTSKGAYTSMYVLCLRATGRPGI